jgi:outer membrane protein OmpU
MKHTLLATTALVAMTGAAFADFTISGTGRIGLLTTEGVKGSDATWTAGAISANAGATLDFLDTRYGGSATTITGADTAISDADVAAVEALIVDILAVQAAGLGDATEVQRAAWETDLATVRAIKATAMGARKAKVDDTSDTTSAINRMRFTFKGSGETQNGIAYGVSGRFEQSNSSTAGSQFVSGAFGKISMGDLDGADEVAAGGGVSGVGLSGLSDTNDIAYQSSSHNLGYEYTMSDVTFAYSQNTAVTSGSNSAMGLKYSGDMGGASITVGLGQSKVGTATQATMSAAVTTGGLTFKAYSSSNDNGPVIGAKGVTQTATAAFEETAAEKATPDTDQTALSVSYTMGGMSVTAFNKTVSTTGSADMDYSGFGFTYDMDGVTVKAGVVDNNDQQLMDFGVSFSF